MDLNWTVDCLVADLSDGQNGYWSPTALWAVTTRGVPESIPCAGLEIKEVQRLVSEVVDFLDTTELWLNLRQT